MSRTSLMQCFSALVVILIVFVFGGYWYVYNVIAKPTIYAAVVFNIVFGLALWSYLAASLTNPGTPACAEWQSWARDLEPKKPMQKAQQPERCWLPGSPSFCNKCLIWRPERSHHCKSLGICVLRMDHFCPWIGNCVGFRNHKQFVLMNLYITLASLIGLFTLREPDAITALSNGMFVSVSEEHTHSGFVRTLLSIAVVICLTFTLVTLMLFAIGMYHASLNLTQIERKYKGPNPYLLPTKWDNIRQLFGACSIWLLLPIQTIGSHSLGTSFPHSKGNESNAAKGYGSIDSTTLLGSIP
eukprot:gnl/MRDRNA2_/MRDRNA2_117330_c0_seq1.p1 gnl/MRDRNA2_/MRDRNA2_117330_c0~~gnl/MRDRNA2_/MRDRNA2_117330_c0_seq1.p1  ORF type:complete len:299 (-),score=24.49 gnl/MRDRNA2_/MRDRNA2_117330_c0_seq1:99-995(-)